MAPSSNADTQPTKRQRTTDGYVPTGYDSAADSGDDLFEGITTPVGYETQPTQIIGRDGASSPAVKRDNVLIPASSPFRASDSKSSPASSVHAGNRVASLMAPAGTVFRPPPAVPPVQPSREVICLDDDDGPKYAGGSSDDDIPEPDANIKPTVFQPKISFKSTGSFKDLMATFARGSSSGNTPKTQIYAQPARALPVDRDVSMSELDLGTRRKVERIQAIVPGRKVADYTNALAKAKGYVDDATQILLDTEPIHILSDDDEASKTATKAKSAKSQETVMKRQLNTKLASIADRYSSTQNARKPPVPLVASPAAVPAKPKRKLVQGRRNPAADSSPVKPSPSAKPEVLNLEDDNIPMSDGDVSDSDVEPESESDEELDGRVLAYLNKCTVEELVDLTNQKEAALSFFLAQRPFKNLNMARLVSDAKELKNGRKSTRAPIGEKIVDTTTDMMTGYEAVDSLVSKCSEVGKPLAEEMAGWGLDIFGAAKTGELEMVSLEEDFHDSGIGTPNSKGASENGDDDVKALAKKPRAKLLKKPKMMSDDLVLKDYQLVGLNWLALLYKHKLSCILADDMGLGKTCQVIAFLSYLVESGEPGPHLVIVPPSTLENWLREFANFSPQLVVEPYYGSQKERQDIAQRVLQEHEDVNVVVSTYDFAAKKEDSRFLKQLNPNVCVFDEGHVLKNPKSLKYQGLIRIPAKFRLLLTGTPLQNNLMELATLLGFILPQIFQERQGDLDFIFKHKASTRDADHAALLSAQRIARAKSMLTPFVLRRKKAQVLRHMPAKISRVEHCDMDPYQARIYDGFVEKGKEKLRLRAEGAKLSKDDENNPLMQLRKAAIHPMLFRRHFTDEKLKSMLDLLKMHEADEFSQPRDKIMMEMQNFSDYYLHRWCLLYPCIKKFDVPDLMWMDSGKVKALVRLINEYKKNGDRVLVFSQFTLVLDILEAVFETARIAYTRIDGATKVNERQTLIDEFRDDTSITAFLLSTGAGGTGINLMFANKVIIFDSSFNPQEDVQAENRAHRVGQTREVEVVRFVTKGTIEEQIYALGQSKLQLDDKVSGDADIATEKGEEMVAKMLLGNEKQGS